MSASKLDAMYRSILLTKFFTKGWGKPENLRRLFEFRKVVSNRDECFKLVERDYPVTITKEQNMSDCKLLEGYFVTPLERYLPGIVPQVAQKAHFQALLPNHWPEKGCKPMCLHLAGTGDHFFWRRRNLMVKPLLKEAGIGGIILENPFYGLRKPTDQVRSSLHNVSDIFVMGGCLILESLVLFHWCERNGLGPLGVTGLSMGGHMASLAATNWPKPLVLVPCLSWSTASAVFLQGVMSHSINWDLLEDQYLSDGVYREKLSKMVTIVDEAFLAGKKFARTYTESVFEKSDPIDKHIDISLDSTKTTSKPDINVVDLNQDLKNLKQSQQGVKQSFVDMENLQGEVKKLFEENRINKQLYDKLTSNEKFELDPHDIEDINSLTKSKVKEILLRCKVADVRNNYETVQKNQNLAKESKSKENKVLISKETSTNEEIKIISKANKISDSRKLTSCEEESEANLKELNSSTALIMKTTEEIKLPVVKKDRKWHMSDLTSDLWMQLPFLRPSGKKIDITKIHWRDREALQFMRGVMDECTHLSNFSIPFDTSLIIAVCAKHDAYVPRVDVGALEEIWPGAEVRYVDAGHVSAYILHQSMFRSCIREAFERSKKKWKDGKHLHETC